jgi:hypothetical protein
MDEQKTEEFRVQTAYVAVFYLLLLVWTVVSIPLVWRKLHTLSATTNMVFYGAMVAFVYVYTWFWSLGVFYRVSIDGRGGVAMKSIRRELTVPSLQISQVEGSRFPNSFGFIKLKLPKERVYIFCLRKTEEVERVLAGMKKANPLLIRVNI